MGECLIEIESPVAHYIPSFVENGKDLITVEQVLCHTGGFPEHRCWRGLVDTRWTS